MAFTISAPYPVKQTTIVLPNPQLGNSIAGTTEVAQRRMMSGRVQTYVKRKNQRKRLIWTFRAPLNKAIEVREFIASYHGSPMWVEDHDGNTWVGFLMSNPVEFDEESRSIPGGDAYQATGSGTDSTVTFTVEFQAWPYPITGERPPTTFEINVDSSPDDCTDPNRIKLSHSVKVELIRNPGHVSIGLVPQHRWDASSLNYTNNDKVLKVNNLGTGDGMAYPYLAPGGLFWNDTYGDSKFGPEFVENAFGSLPGIYFAPITVYYTLGPNRYITTSSMLQTIGSGFRFTRGGYGVTFMVIRNATGDTGANSTNNRWFQQRGSRVIWSTHRGARSAFPYYGRWLRSVEKRPEEAFAIEPGGSTLRPASYWPRITGSSVIRPSLGWANLYRRSGVTTDAGNPRGGVEVTDEDNLVKTGVLDGQSVLVRGRPYVLTMIQDDQSIRFRINGYENKGTTTPARTNFGRKRLYFGRTNNSIGTPARYFLGEFRNYHTRMSDEQIESIEDELMTKWEIPFRHWQQEEECFNDVCITGGYVSSATALRSYSSRNSSDAQLAARYQSRRTISVPQTYAADYRRSKYSAYLTRTSYNAQTRKYRHSTTRYCTDRAIPFSDHSRTNLVGAGADVYTCQTSADGSSTERDCP